MDWCPLAPLGLPDISLGISCHQKPATMALRAHGAPKVHAFFLKRPSRVSELLGKKESSMIWVIGLLTRSA